VALILLQAFRGRRFLEALRVLCPELGDAQPGVLKERAAAVFAHCGGGRRSGACRRLFAARIPGAGRIGNSGINDGWSRSSLGLAPLRVEDLAF
jgi:hypothetical protein